MANEPIEMEGSAKMPKGYAKLSSLMSTDSEFAIFRKFGALNAQNLLYYQAELRRMICEQQLQRTRIQKTQTRKILLSIGS